ncbi:alpha/beta fold hydrolase [Dongia soli]|uniref:Alpha/beta fold hydrolase n=1 Tax=Dongia soli TaxID=600628 RepID=A0ABU5ECZ2_9PROT|nr:alpha/beta fold hydrolase [Dongia soli]MDY0884248.1 alpha/beta fold hydrolase [Dongia soli]
MMTPITFSNCFGWLHPSTGGLGVVICNPHGYEELCVHRILRNLAEDLAAAGMPTLRFDYYGTGNSVGTAPESERTEIWIENIREAVHQLRALTKVERVALVGLRLGGLLATRAVEALDDVVAMALLAPVHSGRAYVREVKTLARMSFLASAAGSERTSEDPNINLAGFIMTPKLAGEISALDITQKISKPPKRVLVMKGPENPADDFLVEKFQQCGSHAEAAAFPAYAEMMVDAVFAKKPEQAFLFLKNWLSKDLLGTSVVPASFPEVALAEEDWVERPIFFGQDSRLFAIHCAPSKQPARPLAVIFVTTGSNHQIGAGRRSVIFTRRLAALGYITVRVDIAGLGDSPPRPGRGENVLFDGDSVRDISAAIDWLESQGINQVVITGISAGAYLSFHGAVQDARVVGAVPVNPPNFVRHIGDSLQITLREEHHATRYYFKKMTDWGTWKRFFKGDLNVRGVTGTIMHRGWQKLNAELGLILGPLSKTENDTAKVRRWFKLLQSRKTQLLLIYSHNDGGLDGLSVHLGRDGRKLKRFRNVNLVIMTGTDHVLTASSAKEEFFGMLVEFLGRCEGPARSRSTPLLQQTVK